MSSFFQPSYWFTLQAPEVGGVLGTIVFGVFIAFFVLGIIGRIVVDRRGQDRYKKEIASRISTLLVTMGLLGSVLFFFSFEGIQLFGARFWYPVWIITSLVWVLYLVRYVRRDLPAKRLREQHLREQSKYLPH